MLLAILGVALVVRVAVVAATPEYIPENDAADYHRHAVSIAAGNGYPESLLVVDGGPTAARTPAYPYFLGAVYAVTGNSVTAGRLANAALGVVAVFLLYLVTARVASRSVAYVAAGVAAVFPPLVTLSLSVLSEPLGMVFALGTVLALLEYKQSGDGRMLYAVIAGALAGLVALSRGNGLLVVLFAVAAVALLRGRPLRRCLLPAAVTALAATLVLAPWVIRNLSAFDRFVLVSTHSAAIAGTYNDVARGSPTDAGQYHPISALPELRPLLSRPGQDEADAEAALRSRGVDYALDHPGYIAKVVWLNTLRLFEIIPLGDRFAEGQGHERGLGVGVENRLLRPSALLLEFLALVCVVLLLVRRTTQLRAGTWFIWLMPVAILVATAPIDGRPRYRVFLDPFLIVLASVALVALRERFVHRA